MPRIATVADAVAFDADGAPRAVVDWKSDVAPAPAVLQQYRAQVQAYLQMTGAWLGLIVLAMTGEVIRVEPEGASRVPGRTTRDSGSLPDRTGQDGSAMAGMVPGASQSASQAGRE